MFSEFICLFILVNQLNSEYNLTELKMTHMLFRHGDRTPFHFYPNDPFKDQSMWGASIGQLTNEGKRMGYELGQWIREHYNDFLNKDYKKEEIYVRSTDVDRTIMTAQTLLAGLYPPHGDNIWNKDLAWQPIPVHVVPQAQDILFAEDQPCPRIDQLDKELRDSDYMKDEVYKANKDLFDYISRSTGSNITTVKELAAVYDTLLVETFHNKTLPEWTKSVFPQGKFDQLRKLSFIHDTYNDEMKKLKAGPFLAEIVSHYKNLTSQEKKPENLKKVYLYSVHDISITRVLNSLELYNNLPPPYASMIIFNLVDQGGMKVGISYRNNTDTTPYSLALPGCDLLCPLEKFIKITKKLWAGQWEEDCKVV